MYFEHLQQLQYHNNGSYFIKSIRNDTTSCQSKSGIHSGIYSYSFSINPSDLQPSGSCNMSRYNSIQLSQNFQSIPFNGTDPIFTYDTRIYSVNYNILRIVGGLGGNEFAV